MIDAVPDCETNLNLKRTNLNLPVGGWKTGYDPRSLSPALSCGKACDLDQLFELSRMELEFLGHSASFVSYATSNLSDST